MSKPVYLYRAVATTETRNPFTEDLVTWPGSPIGRATGYLSRSAAVNAGAECGVPFEIVRSEPVIFLTRRERLEREIDRLRAELAETL